MTEPRRERFAAGDYITRHPEGAKYRLWIDSPIEKPGWQERIPGDQLRATHPGSAIELDGERYEVIARATPSAGRVRYYLNPWEEQHITRQNFLYSREECVRVRAEVEGHVRRASAAVWMSRLLPLVGLLSAADQRHIESEYGIFGETATLSSIATMLALSVVGLVLAISAASGSLPGARIGAVIAPHPVFPAYFMVESLWRLYLPRPNGSPAVVAAVALGRWLARLVRG